MTDNSPSYPYCGYDGLREPPWSAVGSPSDEICSCRGIQFGYDDAAGGSPALRQGACEGWRRDWVAQGMPWFSSKRQPPEGWYPVSQIARALGRS
jgi:hypothetical protein